VLLLYPAGLRFVQAFYACLLANVVAVPAPLPTTGDRDDKLHFITRDCEPAAVFTEAGLIERVRMHLPDLYHGVVTATDDLIDEVPVRLSESVAESGTAMLQYTSGSTSSPKGVVLSTANIMANLRQIEEAFGHSCESSGVIWLPHYHDMGLIGGILQPLFVGFPVTLFAPISFVQRPLRWVHAIHKYRATTSGGPNFAYGLCAAKAAALDTPLDLSCWKVAFNGAEPIKAQSFEAFCNAFSAHGFSRSAMTPCYGLAEATLLVSSVSKDDEPRIVNSKDLRITAQGIATTTREQLVSCGSLARDIRVQVVKVGSEEECREGEVGELIVYGPGVASGYWNKVDETFIHGGIRTGDLGFKLDDEFYITGRLRDLILVRGKNVFPEDVEATVQIAEPRLVNEGSAAFSIDETEALILLQEIGTKTLRSLDLEAMRDEVSRLVMQRHGISIHAFVPVRSGSLARTSSGKISRRACKQLYLDQKLQRLSL